MSSSDSYFTLPAIRKIVPRFEIAQKVFKVQPMPLPTSMVFYLDYVYGNHYNLFETEIKLSQNIRETLKKLLGENKDNILKKVVEEKYPQYLDILNKMLLIR